MLFAVMPEVQEVTEPDFYITVIMTSNDRKCLFISNGSEIDRLTTRVLKEYRKRLTADQEEENNVFSTKQESFTGFFL